MQLDFATRELTIKIVYYGPALSGKTTNLVALHRAASADSSGRLMTLETRDDRTLFFDLLPLTFRGQGLSVRLKIFTVPGQVIHASTRRLVVQGADGVVFVADSRVAETDHNTESFVDLRTNLKQNGIRLSRLPLVIQFNKRDLPDIRSGEEIAAQAAVGREPVYLAVATKGEGVVESFMGVLSLTWTSLDAEHELCRKFGFDGDAFLDEVARKFGATSSSALVGACVGGATRVLRPEGGS